MAYLETVQKLDHVVARASSKCSSSSNYFFLSEWDSNGFEVWLGGKKNCHNL